jgi:hypothetical protein
VSCSRMWSRGSTSVASGAPRVAGSIRPVVADGWRCLLGVARVGLVKTWGKVGVCDEPALPVLIWGRYGKMMFFLLTFRLNCTVWFLISGSWSDSTRLSWGFSHYSKGTYPSCKWRSQVPVIFQGIGTTQEDEGAAKAARAAFKEVGSSSVDGSSWAPESSWIVGRYSLDQSKWGLQRLSYNTWGCIMLYIVWLPCDDIVKYAHFRDQHSMAQSCSIYTFGGKIIQKSFSSPN